MTEFQDQIKAVAQSAQEWSNRNREEGGVCDFCLARVDLAEATTYVTSATIVDTLVAVSGADAGSITNVCDPFWAACSDCDPIVASGDIARLVERVVAATDYERLGLGTKEQLAPRMAPGLERIYRDFFALKPERRVPGNPETVIYQAEFRETAFGFNAEAHYREVWREPNGGRDLDDVWVRFQRVDEETCWPPEGYEARSLSIGDVVGFTDDRGVLRCWTPEAVGFRELTADEVEAVRRG